MKRVMGDDRGMVLAVLIGFVSVLGVGLTALTALMAQQTSNQHRTLHSTQAFYLAEAAVEKAKVDLRADFDTHPSVNEDTIFQLGDGEYFFEVDITADPDVLLVTGRGAVPDFASPEQTRSAQVTVRQVPTNVGVTFDYAIFAADTIDINGSANTVDGDIFAGNNIDCSPAACPGVTGDKTEEGDDDYPMPELDMEAMKAIAISQGNYFSSTPDVSDLPTSFYHTPPSGGSLGIPNVVYIEGDLTVGSGQTAGGFLIVAGNYATDPDEPGGNITMNGNATVNGVIYALGSTTTNGGGSTSPTINGVIYAQEIVTLNGKPSVTNNSAYVDALEAAEFQAGEIEGSGWNELPA